MWGWFPVFPCSKWPCPKHPAGAIVLTNGCLSLCWQFWGRALAACSLHGGCWAMSSSSLGTPVPPFTASPQGLLKNRGWSEGFRTLPPQALLSKYPSCLVLQRSPLHEGADRWVCAATSPAVLGTSKRDRTDGGWGVRMNSLCRFFCVHSISRLEGPWCIPLPNFMPERGGNKPREGRVLPQDHTASK